MCNSQQMDLTEPIKSDNDDKHTNEKKGKENARHTLGFGSFAAKEIENVVQELSSPRHRPHRSTASVRAFEYFVLMKISCDRFRMRKIDIMFEKSLSTALILGRKENGSKPLLI